ncbi:MAG: gliding-associated putative transporter substrate-binding component GldG [Acidobacteria bacterium]|nr:gliding-associated putative transporter substrate-binding component GldG [Acidobacteriota bacterium]
MLHRILNVLGWVGTALVFSAVAVRFLRPELREIWNGLAIAGLVCVLLYMMSQWRELVRAFSGRQARYGTLAVASVAIVLGILVGLNYIASRQNKRWDLSAAKQFTLSDQTRKVVQELKEPIRVLVFGREDDFRRIRDRLDEYTYVSPRVKVDYIDLDRQPAMARQYQIQSYGTIIVEYAGRSERTTLDTEQDITNTIIKATQGQQKKVYFVQGHGEKDTASSDERSGYNAIATALGRDNFTVETVVLAQRTDVPGDASVVVVAGPTVDYLPGEIEALRRYLDKGGKLLLMLDPADRDDSPPLTNLVAFAREWGFEVGDDVVLDEVGQMLGTGASAPVAASFPSHPITDRFRLLTAFPLTRSVGVVSGGSNGRFAQAIVETSPQSFAKKDMSVLRTGGEVAMDASKGDRQGPIPIAAAVSATAPNPPEAPKPAAQPGPEGEKKGASVDEPKRVETRMVVFGDSDFPSNGVLGIPGNRDLFLNSVNWLAQQENLIAIRPREPEDRRVTLTAERQRLAFYLSVLVIPGLAFLIGFATWWRRR